MRHTLNGRGVRGAAPDYPGEELRESHRQQVDGDAAHDLVGLEHDGHDRVDQGDEYAREHAREYADPRIARVVGGDDARERPREHDALERDIDNARALREEPPE